MSAASRNLDLEPFVIQGLEKGSSCVSDEAVVHGTSGVILVMGSISTSVASSLSYPVGLSSFIPGIIVASQSLLLWSSKKERAHCSTSSGRSKRKSAKE
jgi:hypothetical protein